MAPQRVLVVGDVNGQISQLYKRVESVVKKTGAFDALLVAGSFFGLDGAADESWEKFKQGELKGEQSNKEDLWLCTIHSMLPPPPHSSPYTLITCTHAHAQPIQLSLEAFMVIVVVAMRHHRPCIHS